MKPKEWVLPAVTVISLSGGFLAGKIVGVPGITCQTELNPLQALSIVVTIYIAVAFGVVLSRRDKVSDVEKQLVIGKLAKIEGALQDVRGLVLDGNLGVNAAVAFRKQFTAVFLCVWDEGKLCRCKGGPSMESCEGKIAEIHRMMTTQTICDDETVTSPDVSVKDKKMVYSAPMITKLDSQFGALSNDIFALQIRVNSM